MKYQIADLVNGPFGRIYDSLVAAEEVLQEIVVEGQAANDQIAADTGVEPANAAGFFNIVEVPEFEYEWSDDLIGYVVTNDKGQQANIQFEYNSLAPHEAGWAFGCEGDDSYDNFTEDERERALSDLSECDDWAASLKDCLKDIYADEEKKAAFEQLSAKGAGVTVLDIRRLNRC